jgi:hypothetical protein
MVLFQLNLVGFNEDPCVKEFGLSVSDRFEEVGARILDAPKIQYNLQAVSKYIRIL